MGLFLTIYLTLCSNTAFGGSLKASADKLAQETTRIGFGIALFGLVLAGIYFMIGKQDASTKMTQALMGLFILILSPSILTFVKGLA